MQKNRGRNVDESNVHDNKRSKNDLMKKRQRQKKKKRTTSKKRKIISALCLVSLCKITRTFDLICFRFS